MKTTKQTSTDEKLPASAVPDASESRTEAKIMVRRAVEADVPRMLEIYAPYIQNTTYSFEYTVPSLEEFTSRFDEITSFYPWFVAVADGTVVGYAYGSRMFERAAYQWDADVSIYIDKGWHGLHIGTMLYDTLEHTLAQMGFYNLYALITAENHTSCLFHERRGYVLCGTIPHTGYKMGRWLDLQWYAKTLQVGNPASSPHAEGKTRENPVKNSTKLYG